MAKRLEFPSDPVPQPVGGIMTAKCECGWEMPFIMPEEQLYAMTVIFLHLKDVHHIEFPTICCFWH